MNRNTFFTLVFIGLLAAIGYVWYAYFQSAPDTAKIEPRFTKSLSEVRQLKRIKLDTSLFQDSFFRDSPPPAPPPAEETVFGRQNPFIPFR